MFHSKENKVTMFVKKIEWEYREKYGHVFYPKSLEEFRNKLDELDRQAMEKGFPFYVDLYFANNRQIGIIVGHQLSVFYFFERLEEGTKDNAHSFILDWHFVETNEGADLEYSYGGSWSEAESKKLLSKLDVLKAINQYIETQKLPSYIRFTRQDFNDKYVQSI